MVDHPDQLRAIYEIRKESCVLPHIYIKVDMGYHRAGVPQGQAVSQLISDLLLAEEANTAIFSGLYSHAGHSYYGDNTASAVHLLRPEFEALSVTAEAVHSASPNKKLIPSVGVTPTATSVRNLLLPELTVTGDEQMAISALKATTNTIKIYELRNRASCWRLPGFRYSAISHTCST
jgi:D-serine ammonia-lyase